MAPVHNNAHCNPPWFEDHKRMTTAVDVQLFTEGVGDSARQSRRHSAPTTVSGCTTSVLLPRLTVRNPHGVADVHTPEVPATPREDTTYETHASTGHRCYSITTVPNLNSGPKHYYLQDFSAGPQRQDVSTHQDLGDITRHRFSSSITEQEEETLRVRETEI